MVGTSVNRRDLSLSAPQDFTDVWFVSLCLCCACNDASAMMLHAHVHARFFSCHGFRTRHVHSYITCLSCMHDVSSHVPRCHLHDGSMFMFVLVHELWFVFHIDVYVIFACSYMFMLVFQLSWMVHVHNVGVLSCT